MSSVCLLPFFSLMGFVAARNGRGLCRLRASQWLLETGMRGAGSVCHWFFTCFALVYGLRLVAARNGHELCRFNLTDESTPYRGIVLAKISCDLCLAFHASCMSGCAMQDDAGCRIVVMRDA
eukprot:1262457-Rhodomonas_salina.1